MWSPQRSGSDSVNPPPFLPKPPRSGRCRARIKRGRRGGLATRKAEQPLAASAHACAPQQQHSAARMICRPDPALPPGKCLPIGSLCIVRWVCSSPYDLPGLAVRRLRAGDGADHARAASTRIPRMIPSSLAVCLTE